MKRFTRTMLVLITVLALVLPQGAQAQISKPATQSAALNAQYDCSAAPRTSWTDGKFLSHWRMYYGGQWVPQIADLGHLGPDDDVVSGLDFNGVIPAGFQRINNPANPSETRIVFTLRTDIQYVQFKGVLGGDEFHLYQVALKGGDTELARQTYCHAQNTARAHQLVYLIGDWGSFLRQYGKNELDFISQVVWCQNPPMPELGIQACDFVTGP